VSGLAEGSEYVDGPVLNGWFEGWRGYAKMPLRGLSRSMEVLLKMIKRMNRKMKTSLPTLRIDLMSMICKEGRQS